ncbi:MAG: phosphotransferase, partial [Planctomycetota bacterium]|nr:phosphotransferase [Planctomycetota bacterium]
MILKTGARRTVTREWEGGRSQIVKRYHARGVWNRVGDRLRAAREFAALEQLAARGLPVPAPIEVRRRNGQWELILEDLSDAVSLDDLLEGREPWPVPATQVAPHLGRLLAALVGGGVRHGDLHAGNVLVQPDGRVALIDLARVRLGATVEPEGLLVGCAAGLRERDPRGFRARVLAAFRAAGGDRSLDP